MYIRICGYSVLPLKSPSRLNGELEGAHHGQPAL
jgi:hypothetical protein